MGDSQLASVLVMGAGAVGSYYGALLARDGHDVTLVARGPHLDALRETGRIVVREPDGTRWEAPVRASATPGGSPDLVIVTTKSHAGRALLALERPGLWNGSMAHWNTVFVEVPIETFTPVKSVMDLLRPEHR